MFVHIGYERTSFHVDNKDRYLLLSQNGRIEVDDAHHRGYVALSQVQETRKWIGMDSWVLSFEKGFYSISTHIISFFRSHRKCGRAS
jgi:hypothetical protein